MISKCIKVKKQDAREILEYLKNSSLLNRACKIKRNAEFVHVPVIAEIEGFVGYDEEFQEYEKRKSYKELVNVPDSLRSFLPSSYDLVGDIAILKIPEILANYTKNIADALIETNIHINKVAVDEGVKGEFRIRALKLITGPNLITVHREFSISLKMNLETVYFSPRLATERMRIAMNVKDGEMILDMFCGVGPFSILIGSRKSVKIYAIDKNPEAIRYLKENILLNHLSNITPIEGDAMMVAQNLGKMDRIIMNNPHYSLDFLDLAIKLIKPQGLIHLYSILNSTDINRIEIALSSKNLKFDMKTKKVHDYSPVEALYCFDIVMF